MQGGGAFMASEGGTAYSLGVQKGVGLEVETVVGYTKTVSWGDIENDIQTVQRRMGYY